MPTSHHPVPEKDVLPAASINSEENVSTKEAASVDVHTVKGDDLCDSEPEAFSLSKWLLCRRQRKPLDLDSIATKRSVYDDSKLAKYYWPKADYENLHRFDVNARWTHREERALVRKIDWRVMLWAAISFSALNLDRNNLLQANTDNFLPDLGMDTDDFNLGNSVFRLAFLAAELPSQLVSKKLGPDVWIPIQMVIWSIITISQFWLKGRTSFLICRALLGFSQGGFIPDLVLYLSYFYTKYELPFRLSLFWVSLEVCSVLASFLAYGVLHMRGIHGQAGWRWLFLIEGLITFAVGITTFFMMPPSPTQTKSWFRPKGWFTEREEVIATTRILRDDPTKGDMHNREGLTPKRMWQSLCDYDLWPLYIIGLLFSIPVTPPAQYLTLSLKNLGFGTFETNLLTIPSTVGRIINMMLITLASEMVHERTYVAMTETAWALPFVVALYALPQSSSKGWNFYGLSTLLLSYPYSHAIQVGWCSRNAGAVASRTVSASLYNMFVQASAVVASNIYRKDDAPLYRRGNRTLMIIAIANLVVMYPLARLYYVWRNKQRDKVWDAMSEDQKVEYLETTKDIGNRRLDFRFAY
ncbi:allantoate permease [Macrolepiota fuliginosa MF-IS2]|uniref:Allantoate permease n=1 Tax=Macrolepiota fuliginosa MF-IS2 TaxID=1400762 RepID=A0A9P5X3Y2_9AGAR|nr:allantoate permease [Macrolepiota fuliginosa MF-IS2]